MYIIRNLSFTGPKDLSLLIMETRVGTQKTPHHHHPRPIQSFVVTFWRGPPKVVIAIELVNFIKRAEVCDNEEKKERCQ